MTSVTSGLARVHPYQRTGTGGASLWVGRGDEALPTFYSGDHEGGDAEGQSLHRRAILEVARTS